MVSSGNIIPILRRVSSLAIVGASPIKGKVGYELLQNVVKFGFSGDIYPVNPKYEEVMGFKCYRSPRDIPEKVDLAVIAIPAPYVPDIIGDLCYREVDVAVIVSSGFRERGRADLEEALIRIASDCGMRLIGPNSAGITSTPSRLHASIEVLPEPGRVAVVSHSGAVGGVAIYELGMLRSGVSYFISLGNSVDVGVEEVLEGLVDDPYTDGVVLYVEWVKEGRRFMHTLRKVSATKPVAVVKGGWGKASSEAVLTHTGGLAVPHGIFKIAVKQAGAAYIEDVEEAVAFVELMRKLGARINSVSKVLIITNSGGYGILTASHLESTGMNLVPVGNNLANAIKVVVGRDFSGRNPVDFGGDSRATDIIKTLQVEGIEQHFDMAIVVYVPTSAESPSEICEEFKRHEERIPTIYLVAGGGSTWITRCISEVKPAISSIPILSKFLSHIREKGLTSNTSKLT